MEEKDFMEIKVQLARIESNLEGIPELKNELKANNNLLSETHHRSIQNEKDIASINDRLTWLTRTVSGAIIVAVIGAIITIL
ncbi:tail fiber [Enterococcus phage VEsP-2]|nr:tail fiber protein [Enterococcus phage Nonaheksakonda]QIQ66136.1 hemolysin [Enterococcus phage heks]QYS24416.1 tail fiber [Enterococcus phage VEsP-2]UVX34449.1 MAG: hemolysin [Bacteriophage sp.]